MSAFPKVAGYCPMGCGEKLYLGVGGYITCGWLQCPHPDAASTILGDGETQHIVVLEQDTFSIQHPLRERLNGDLFDCGLHAWIVALDGPPRTPGRYRVTQDPNGDVWEAL